MFLIGNNGTITGGDPNVPTPPTPIAPAWLQMLQAELAAIVAAGGLNPDPGNSAQVLAALRALIASGGTALASDAETIAGAIATKATTPHGVAAALAAGIIALIGGAPGNLSTLGGLATAVNNDPAFSFTVATAIAARAMATRQIGTSGLATGGGDLTNDRTISVAAASAADYLAGTRADVALTPESMTGGGATGSNGYGKWTTLPGGFLMQWGRVTVLSNGGSVATGSITFPKPFTTICDSITGTADGPANSQWEALVTNFPGGPSLAGCQVGLDSAGTTKQPIAGAHTVYWKAIGQ